MKKIITWAICSSIFWAMYFYLNSLPKIQFELSQPSDWTHLTWSVAAVLICLICGMLITLGWPLYILWNRAADKLANVLAQHFIP